MTTGLANRIHNFHHLSLLKYGIASTRTLTK